jgi:hypothetical protein
MRGEGDRAEIAAANRDSMRLILEPRRPARRRTTKEDFSMLGEAYDKLAKSRNTALAKAEQRDLPQENLEIGAGRD